MSQALDPVALNASLRRLRYSALLALGACMAGIGLHALRAEPSSAELDRGYIWIALALAAASILLRRSVGTAGNPRALVGFQIGSVLAAVGLGILGAWLAVRFDQIQPGILYNLAAALLLMRPPARFAFSRPRPRA